MQARLQKLHTKMEQLLKEETLKTGLVTEAEYNKIVDPKRW